MPKRNPHDASESPSQAFEYYDKNIHRKNSSQDIDITYFDTTETDSNPPLNREPETVKHHYDSIQRDSITALSDESITDVIRLGREKYHNIPITIQEKAFLWEAKKEGCAPIRIFSSLHYITFDLDDVFGDVISNTIDQSSTVFTEVNLLDTFILYPQASIDVIIAKKSSAMNKTLKVLETERVRKVADTYIADDNNKISAVMPLEYTKKENTQHDDSLSIFNQQYLTHVSPPIHALNLAGSSLTQRNFFWIPEVIRESNNNIPSLIVCGSNHNAGKYGLPNLLATEGYTVIPVLKHAPIPRSQVLRKIISDQHILNQYQVLKKIIPDHPKPNQSTVNILRNLQLHPTIYAYQQINAPTETSVTKQVRHNQAPKSDEVNEPSHTTSNIHIPIIPQNADFRRSYCKKLA